jgi:hypothetical protein
MRTDGQTDMPKLVVVYRNFAKAPNAARSALWPYFSGCHQDVEGTVGPTDCHQVESESVRETGNLVTSTAIRES